VNRIVYIPLLYSVLYALLAPRLARHLPGRHATWLLSAGGFVVAGTAGWSLALLAFPLLSRVPWLAEAWSWSESAVDRYHPVPLWVSAIAAPVLLVLLARTFAGVVTQIRRLVAARELAARFPGTGGDLVVVDDANLQAAAIAGRGGRIVISSSVLAELTPEERTVVLEHERSHLRHRHYLHHAAVALAAAGNPLMHRFPAALALATERWADEDAARTGSRAAVARTLVRLAAQQNRSGSRPGLAIAATDTESRVDSLLGGEQPRRFILELVALVVLVDALSCAIGAGRETELIFEWAMDAFN
jgi:Zn-dependent protease with chaperone function